MRSYADSTPRHAFVDMLESCITIGLTTILGSTVQVLFHWEATGRVTDVDVQRAAPFFVDCSNGGDRRLRLRAEQSTDDLMRRLERVPVILMALRLLDYEACFRPRIRSQKVAARPYATEWLNLLGDLVHDRHAEAQRIAFAIEDKAEKLAAKLTEDHDDVASTLLGTGAPQGHSVWRLASGLMALKGAGDWGATTASRRGWSSTFSAVLPRTRVTPVSTCTCSACGRSPRRSRETSAGN